MLLKVTFGVCLDCVSSMMFTCVHSLSLCPCLIAIVSCNISEITLISNSRIKININLQT